IYHYAPYEVTACRKLMGRFGVCEQEVDDLLRRGVFVDLYKIVKSGLLVGTPNYSIKSIERLYGSEHQGEVANGGDSIVAYENYRNKLANGERAQANTILKNIEAYNKDDCDSTQELTAWLRQLQQEKGISYQASIINVEQKELTDEQKAVLALRDRLLTQAESLKQDNAIFANQLANIAWMLEFHRREDKPKWWKYFDRMDATEEELWDDLDCLAMCQRTEREPIPIDDNNVAYEYNFDVNQDFKGGKEEFIVLGLTTDNGKDVKVKLLKEESSLKKGVITLKSSQVLPQTITLIPNDYINPKPIPTALQQVIEAINTQGNTTHCAIQHFLAKQPPKI
ncbi:MAG TPA: ribonuclease H-like domain-containing protein, partial [Agitococcus sp.]|nr:ribonuclease H-like domain-containing protein [Agitococcus sp.]